MKNKSNTIWPMREELEKDVTKVTAKNIKGLPKEVQLMIARYHEEGEAAFLTEKYYIGLRSITERDLKALFKKAPDRPIKDVVSQLIGDLPELPLSIECLK
jgi:hypothetical protein